MTEAERRFHKEIRLGTERLKKEIGYNPTYFNRMVAEYGPVDASRRLIGSDAVSDGFSKLWEHGWLGMSVEALAVLPWYAGLFEPDLVAKARRRLEEYPFDSTATSRRARSPRGGSRRRWPLWSTRTGDRTTDRGGEIDDAGPVLAESAWPQPTSAGDPAGTCV